HPALYLACVMSRWDLRISCSVSPRLNLYQRSTDPEAVGIRGKSPSSVLFSYGTVAALTESATASARQNLREVPVASAPVGWFDTKEQLGGFLADDITTSASRRSE